MRADESDSSDLIPIEWCRSLLTTTRLVRRHIHEPSSVTLPKYRKSRPEAVGLLAKRDSENS